jgi:hypothetical protein
VNVAPKWFTSGVIARLMAAYPSWPCHAGTIQVFWDALADLLQEAVERAAVAHVAQESAWPLAANLRRLAKGTSDLGRLMASEAWNEMYGHRHAHTEHPKWSTPAVERAARAVNWNDPNWLTEQIPTIRAQFERYYLANKERDERAREQDEASTLLGLASAGPPADGPRRLFAGGGT